MTEEETYLSLMGRANKLQEQSLQNKLTDIERRANEKEQHVNEVLDGIVETANNKMDSLDEIIKKDVKEAKTELRGEIKTLTDSVNGLSQGVRKRLDSIEHELSMEKKMPLASTATPASTTDSTTKTTRLEAIEADIKRLFKVFEDIGKTTSTAKE